MKYKGTDKDKIGVALAGNPNVGKSTLFNSLTGMKRHTGNWAGKTVSIAVSDVFWKDKIYSFADIPGTYSLISHSYEEEIARNYICFGGARVTVVVCDSTSLEHSLSLLLQICEVTDEVIVVLNMMDEAEKAGIKIDTDALSRILGVPVVPLTARKKRTTYALLSEIDAFLEGGRRRSYKVSYPENVEAAVDTVCKALIKYDTHGVPGRWLALRFLEDDESLNQEIKQKLKIDHSDKELYSAISKARELLYSKSVDTDKYRDIVVSRIVESAEKIFSDVVSVSKKQREREAKIDKILTGKFTAFPAMLLLLGIVLFITMFVAGWVSEWFSDLFLYIEGWIVSFLGFCKAPKLLTDALVGGVYRTTATVIAVMLPPMAIFFPMFTLLEDSGYLPRVAYNLDRPFAKCGACGKQSLTMCMALGCNAVGISGARIIDSKRERLLAIVTNSLMPCNGRLPMLISLIGAIFLLSTGNYATGLIPLVLVGFIILSVLVTLLSTFVLSRTLLSGERSSFTIELTPYRRPEIVRVVFRSLTSKVMSVLIRAVVVAAPMGLLIFILTRVCINGVSLVEYAADFLNPLGEVMHLDGKVLLAFMLGLPANEIVLPILIMLYTGGVSFGGEIALSGVSEIFAANGWNAVTALSMSVFALFHWPCSTSIITAYKETKSIKYTLLTVALPTLIGFLLCVLINVGAMLFY